MRNAIKVLMVDVVLLAAAFFVLENLQARAVYAASPHDVCGGLCSFTPSFSYGIFTRSFTMTGNGEQLVSPPILDWVQLLSLALVVVNVLFVYESLVKRRKGKTST